MFHEKMYKLIFLGLILLESVNLSDVSYYEVLGVHKKASIQEIRQAYKKLAVKYHPDKATDDVDQDKFILITEAYETLKDSEKRRQYDLYGSFDSYTKKYSYRTQSEYDNLFHNGLYHDDPNIDSLSGRTFHGYLSEGFHFINFYSPFCPPCQKLVDHWKRLAELYKGIVKVGAVNCKYHNSFCYNSMRIGSYPSLLFYPNGKDGSYVFYHGERTLESLNEFIMAYLSNRVNVPTIAVIRSKEKPMAYVMGTNRIDRSALTRIAFHLKGIVNVVIVIDDNVREQLTKNDLTSVVFIFNEIRKEIETTEEKEVLKEIVEVLPKIDLIGPDELKDIRNELRSGAKSPWVLYFTTNNDDKLLLYQMRVAFPEMYFGIVDCNQWGELCASLQVEKGPAFGVMKVGGAYQRARPTEDVKAFIETAAEATNLHTLSASDLSRILDGEVGMWVIVVVPHQVSWEEVADPFTQTSLQFKDNEDISFGIMACTSTSDKHCRRLTNDEPKVVIQNAGKRHHYDGKMDRYHLSEFIRLLIDNNDLELSEQQVLEIMDASGRAHSWLVAFFPAHCGRVCHHDLWHEWRLVANKLRPLEFVRVGVLECADGADGICGNVRAATARLYPLAAGQHYTVSLQHLSQAPYILEWALGHIDAVQALDWPTFMHTVAAEELKPSGAKKPWLIYFHSPRCYRCYEMYADFAIAGIILHKAVNVGKVNCEAQRALCQHEVVGAFPALRLYLHRNQRQAFSSVISVQADDYATLLQEITPHLKKYDENVLDMIEDLGVRSQGIHMKHDEF